MLRATILAQSTQGLPGLVGRLQGRARQCHAMEPLRGGENAMVLIERVTDYADSAAIDSFVRRAFDLDPEIPDFIRNGPPGRLIVLKPNWVQESHEFEPDVWEPVITHPSLVLAVASYVAELARENATIAICDAPNTYADFARIVERGSVSEHLHRLRLAYPRLVFELIDLRREVWICKEEVIVSRRANVPDPRGYVRVDLGRESLFYGYRGEGKYYGADYDTSAVNMHHHGEMHEYLIAGTPMKADVFINLPKMKTHKKTGITCCLKNLVGVNGDKNWLPHHVEGTPRYGGDEFPDDALAHQLERFLKTSGRSLALAVPGLGAWLYRKLRNAGKASLGDSRTTVRNGNWSGNDTCWRMALDLNRAFYYRDQVGERRAQRRSRVLNIVDGIIGGEGDGPLCPIAVPSASLVAGVDPALVDSVVAALMGFAPQNLPIIANSGVGQGVCPSPDPVLGRPFLPHFGWQGRLERPLRRRPTDVV